MKRRYIKARKTLDGTWKVNAIDDKAFPGDITAWPELDKVTAALVDLGYDVGHVQEGDSGWERAITMLRPDPEDEDYKLYKALGYNTGTISQSDQINEAAAEQVRRLL